MDEPDSHSQADAHLPVLDTVRCAGYIKHPTVTAEDSNQDVGQGRGGAGRVMVSTRPFYSFDCHFVF